MKIKTPTYRSHIGLHYTDEHNIRRVSMQLVLTSGPETGKAVATANFANYGKRNQPAVQCTYFLATDAASGPAVEWRNGLLSAPVSEMLY